ncbi:AIM24 family protein [Methanobrevibacter arboriphilus]|uniref:AIM24 family protein n=1 Tax=Methanobrevibacter arboriphilus TaxID=39441 RepID=UPI000A930C1C|nr:AIM24 family protein [Methanobrevibacter arboriphilus]
MKIYLLYNKIIEKNEKYGSDKMEYEIKGGSFPMVICKLEKGETMKNEGGSMALMTSKIKMESSTGGGILKGLGRALAGDSIFFKFLYSRRRRSRNWFCK